MIRRSAAAVLALGLATSLVACASPVAEPSLTPAKSGSIPVFASDEMAFAAAEEAYSRLQDAKAAVRESAGSNTAGLYEIATGAALEEALGDAETWAEADLHTSGEVAFDVREHVQYSDIPGRGAVIQMHLCEDVGDLSVLRADGSIIAPGDGDTVFPYVVTVEGPSASQLKVSERWQHGMFCF